MERAGSDAIARAVSELVPGGRVVAIRALAPDVGAGVARKDAGYGRPMRVEVEAPGGERRTLVFRTALADPFGHDRRADRWAELLLSFDTFDAIPDHVRALDVGAVGPEGLVSLRTAGEPYLVTTFAEGRLYAEDLRRVARDGVVGEEDLGRCEALARWLGRLHREPRSDRVAWQRALRDLLGSGEGIFGIVDAYPPDTPGASPSRLAAIERRCLDWRWKLRGRADRLRRIHGDFHPFNLVFSEGTRFTLLDASRGCLGDPADDVAALTVNYPFFAIQAPGTWARGFGPLWWLFFTTYLECGGGREVLEDLAPFLAWRALVVCCPRFYPDLGGPARDALLGLAERALDAPMFDPALAEALFR
ncbi:hypothetical protein AMOR_19970 [Anaeromyxobacter oryzae]|uniref:Aminoglycoside phosphotransferase domain-containing protein n=2 Tax=Anaeromyxobacter oryzae TaxID=2918170 RepID=A0ABM7WU31_9BACT|nr:hypothetical protein AMOR_19970 [Anaeromyxobacter oryzae]